MQGVRFIYSDKYLWLMRRLENPKPMKIFNKTNINSRDYMSFSRTEQNPKNFIFDFLTYNYATEDSVQGDSFNLTRKYLTKQPVLRINVLNADSSSLHYQLYFQFDGFSNS